MLSIGYRPLLNNLGLQRFRFLLPMNKTSFRIQSTSTHLVSLTSCFQKFSESTNATQDDYKLYQFKKMYFPKIYQKINPQDYRKETKFSPMGLAILYGNISKVESLTKKGWNLTDEFICSQRKRNQIGYREAIRISANYEYSIPSYIFEILEILSKSPSTLVSYEYELYQAINEANPEIVRILLNTNKISKENFSKMFSISPMELCQYILNKEKSQKTPIRIYIVNEVPSKKAKLECIASFLQEADLDDPIPANVTNLNITKDTAGC